MLDSTRQIIFDALRKLYPKAGIVFSDIILENPPNPEMGDIAVPLFSIARKTKVAPNKMAEALSKICIHNTAFEDVESISGYVNLWFQVKDLFAPLLTILNNPDEFGTGSLYKDQKIMIEFAHPNTHKFFHIGHLRNLSIGESLVRIFEKSGAKIFRSNYQGDVGPHVAKCLWGILNKGQQELQKLRKSKSNQSLIRDRVQFLGSMYALGVKAAEKNSQIEAEIKQLNIDIYNQAKYIIPLWQETRQWSLDYFERCIYKRLHSHFDRCFMESEMWARGLKISRELLKAGILEKSEGAVVFPGEKYGLHRRVFVTSAGTAPYEAKELALAEMEKKAFKFDRNIHVVASEQAGYFQVIFKVLELRDKWQINRQENLAYGMVNLRSGKMSSRTGEVITAEWLIDEARKRILRKLVKNTFLSGREKEDTVEKIAVGAVKFSMLKSSASKNIAFDFETSVSFTGDSGPYIQYAYARICSIFRKAGKVNLKDFKLKKLGNNTSEHSLARLLNNYGNVVLKAAEKRDPSVVCNYLLDLAQAFSSFYELSPILTADKETKKSRLALCKATRIVLASGLYLLGIEAPKRM
ncbi:MAG: arginine--tRNA ligase [Patescibacteria group bacterium]|nr:arginine--tRNA ligase [Patescibacteria group bacterium]